MGHSEAARTSRVPFLVRPRTAGLRIISGFRSDDGRAQGATAWSDLHAGVLGAVAAKAEELGPEQARAFVVGKLFSYTCFDGTVGMGRIFADGSVVGTIRPGGRGEVRFMHLPPGTLRVEGSSMCAHLSGMIMQPCFRVEKIDYRRFRGSISGLGFAYCDLLSAQSARRDDEPPARAHSAPSSRRSPLT